MKTIYPFRRVNFADDLIDVYALAGEELSGISFAAVCKTEWGYLLRAVHPPDENGDESFGDIFISFEALGDPAAVARSIVRFAKSHREKLIKKSSR